MFIADSESASGSSNDQLLVIPVSEDLRNKQTGEGSKATSTEVEKTKSDNHHSHGRCIDQVVIRVGY